MNQVLHLPSPNRLRYPSSPKDRSRRTSYGKTSTQRTGSETNLAMSPIQNHVADALDLPGLGAVQIPETIPKIVLSQEQLEVLNMVKSGINVFFTGPAGTGKSVLLREIIGQLRGKPEMASSVAVTASTGIAGLNIGGSTVHSFAGIGLGKEPANKLAEKIIYSEKLRKRWRGTKILIIDEISMLDGILFDKLEYIARVVRKCQRPFGGIQLVLSGDFFQLPPVPDQSYGHRMPATYAFDALTWPRCISRPVFLKQVFRQKDDVFVRILAALRQGCIADGCLAQLQGLSRPLQYSDGIEPSQLFPLRKEVESCNGRHLDALTGPQYTYCSIDRAGYDVEQKAISRECAKTLLDRLVSPSVIKLKVGAQVMLIQNIEQGVMVNGSVGKVTEFLTTREALERHIQIAQPTQGKSANESEEAKLARLEEEAALRSLDDHVFLVDQAWPLVKFENGRLLLCAPLPFSVEGFMGNVEAHRLQVPLILAWALSIHKSQGQTLTRVKVDLGAIFEKGQAYVALSRATSMEGLEITNFQPSKVLAHPRVLAWHQLWSQSKYDHDIMMDSEEAIARFWD